jgi:hypothetical protein
MKEEEARGGESCYSPTRIVVYSTVSFAMAVVPRRSLNGGETKDGAAPNFATTHLAAVIVHAFCEIASGAEVVEVRCTCARICSLRLARPA